MHDLLADNQLVRKLQVALLAGADERTEAVRGGGRVGAVVQALHAAVHREEGVRAERGLQQHAQRFNLLWQRRGAADRQLHLQQRPGLCGA